MKLATLTLHNSNNYGAILQAYALQKYLLNLGVDTELIDYYHNSKITGVNSTNFNKVKAYLFHIPTYINRKRKAKKFYQFRTDCLRISNEVYKGDNEILLNPPSYDAYIVGSDQIWNTSITNNSKAYYLDFVKKGRKIAYAGSFGKSELGIHEESNIEKYLVDFDFLSVREEQHKKLLSEKFNLNAQLVLDPVFLLDKEKWNEISRPIKLPKKYVLVYVLEYSEDMFQHAKFIAKKLNCSIIYISLISKKIRGNVLEGIGPKEYLYAISNASYICTNSFHGTAFSIIFKKNFTVFKHSTRNSRIANIVELSGLNDRFYNTQTNKLNPIDYNMVDSKIDQFISASKQYIYDSIYTRKTN